MVKATSPYKTQMTEPFAEWRRRLNDSVSAAKNPFHPIWKFQALDMAIKLLNYDAADFLTSADRIRLYLNEALALDDPAVFAKALGDVARAVGMSKIASATGLKRESLYRSFSGEGNPEFGTVVKVAKAVGFDFEAVPRAKVPVLVHELPPTREFGERRGVAVRPLAKVVTRSAAARRGPKFSAKKVAAKARAKGAGKNPGKLVASRHRAVARRRNTITKV